MKGTELHVLAHSFFEVERTKGVKDWLFSSAGSSLAAWWHRLLLENIGQFCIKWDFEQNRQLQNEKDRRENKDCTLYTLYTEKWPCTFSADTEHQTSLNAITENSSLLFPCVRYRGFAVNSTCASPRPFWLRHKGIGSILHNVWPCFGVRSHNNYITKYK